MPARSRKEPVSVSCCRFCLGSERARRYALRPSCAPAISLVHSSVGGGLFCLMIGRLSQSSRQRREPHPSAKEVQVRFEWWTANRNTLLNVRGLRTVFAATDLLRDVICIGDARLLPRFDSVMAQSWHRHRNPSSLDVSYLAQT